MLNRLSLLILSTCLFGLCLANSPLVDAISEQKGTLPTSGVAEVTVASGVNAGSIGAKINGYLKPLAATNNFSGSVMVVEGDRLVFTEVTDLQIAKSRSQIASPPGFIWRRYPCNSRPQR
jgi:hypothetical protein